MKGNEFERKRLAFLKRLSMLPYDKLMEEALLSNGAKEGVPLKTISAHELRSIIDGNPDIAQIFHILQHFHSFIPIHVRTTILIEILEAIDANQFAHLQEHDRIQWILKHTSLPVTKLYAILYDGLMNRYKQERRARDDWHRLGEIFIHKRLGLSQDQLLNVFMIMQLIKDVPLMLPDVADHLLLHFTVKLETFYHLCTAQDSSSYMNLQCAALLDFKERIPEAGSHILFVKLLRYSRYIANHWEDESAVVDVYSAIQQVVFQEDAFGGFQEDAFGGFQEDAFGGFQDQRLEERIQLLLHPLTPTQLCLMKHINESVRDGYFLHQIQVTSTIEHMFEKINLHHNEENYQTWCKMVFKAPCTIPFEQLHFSYKYDYVRWLVQKQTTQSSKDRLLKKYLELRVYDKKGYEQFLTYSSIVEKLLKPYVCEATVTPFLAPLFRFEKANLSVPTPWFDVELSEEDQEFYHNDTIYPSYWYKTHFTHQAAVQLFESVETIAKKFKVQNPIHLSKLWCQTAYKSYKFDKQCDMMTKCSSKLSKTENERIMAAQEFCYAKRLLYRAHCEYNPDTGHNEQLDAILSMIDTCKETLYGISN